MYIIHTQGYTSQVHVYTCTYMYILRVIPHRYVYTYLFRVVTKEWKSGSAPLFKFTVQRKILEYLQNSCKGIHSYRYIEHSMLFLELLLRENLELLKGFEMNCFLCRADDDDSMEVEGEGERERERGVVMGGGHLPQLQEQFSLEYTHLYMKIADTARLQSNYAMCHKYLHLTEQAINDVCSYSNWYKPIQTAPM